MFSVLMGTVCTPKLDQLNSTLSSLELRVVTRLVMGAEDLCFKKINCTGGAMKCVTTIYATNVCTVSRDYEGLSSQFDKNNRQNLF